MLDEATACAEAMALAQRNAKTKSTVFFVDADTHPQTLAVLRTRAEPLGWTIVVGNPETDLEEEDVFGALLSYPGSSGEVRDFRSVIDALHAKGAVAAMTCDPLALVMLEAPGKLGADIAIGSMQRFGVPMGFGGPHAGFMAVRDAYKRTMPGRLVGVSRDSRGAPAIVWRFRPASSISVAKKRRLISARHRCCWRSSPQCMRSITVLKGCAPSRIA